MLLIPVRYFIVPHLGFTTEELEILDGPVASPFVSAAWCPIALGCGLTVDNGIGGWVEVGVDIRTEGQDGSNLMYL